MALSRKPQEIVEDSKNPLLAKHESWERVPVGEIADILNGFAFKSSKFTNDKGIPLIRIRDVGKDSSETYYDGEFDETYLVNDGDLLVGMDGDFRAAIWKGGKALLNQRVCKISLKTDEYDFRFLSYVLQPYLDAIHAETSAVTVKHLSSKSISEIPLPLPPKEQQKRIVAKIEELFSHIDAGIEALKKAKQILKQYRQSVLKAAVTGELTKEWREANKGKLEPASQLLERILKERREKWEEQQLEQFKAKGKIPKDDRWKEKYKEPEGAVVDDLPEIPNEWVWATLPQLGELNRGKSKHRPRNDPSLYGGDYPFVQTGDVRAANTWLKEYSQTYSEKGLTQSRLWPKGTMCITIAANIADTAILEFDACFPDSIVGFIPLDNSVNVEVVEFFIRTVKSDLVKYAPATAQKNINLAILETVAIPILPTEEQEELINSLKYKMSMADRLEEEVDQQLIKAEKNKQSVLASVFSGKIN